MGESIYSHPVATRPAARKPVSAQVASARQLERLLAHDPPAYSLDDLYQQANRYDGLIYLAIRTLVDSLQGATVQVVRPRKPAAKPVRKAFSTPGAQSGDEEYVPCPPGEPLVRLLRHPNRQSPFSDFLAQLTIQYHLHGDVLVWGRPDTLWRADGEANELGRGVPEALYVLPRALCLPVPRSPQYPWGGWRVMPYYAAGTMNMMPGYGAAAGAVLDKREVYRLKDPHPLFNWASVGPEKGGRVQLDLIERVDRACWSLLDNAAAPSGVLDVPGADNEQIEAIQAKMREKILGTDNRGKLLVIGGGDPDRTTTKFTPLQNATELGLGDGYDRYTAFGLALFGLTRAVVGLDGASSYSQLFADLKKVHLRKFAPLLHRVSEFLTNSVGRQWGKQQKGWRVQIDLPRIEDPELLNQKVTHITQSSIGSVDEARALLGMEPLGGEDGKLPAKVYEQKLLAKVQQAAGPQQPPGQPGGGGNQQQPGDDAGSDGDAGDITDFLQPAQQPGGVLKEDNKQAAGSLPPQQKAIAALPAAPTPADDDPAPFGFCPECRQPGAGESGGTVTCVNGHTYPRDRAKYACALVNITGDARERVLGLGRLIDPADLYEPEGGREDDPHLTIFYGLHLHDGAAMRKSWDESKHPRDHGKFSSSPGGGKSPDSHDGDGGRRGNLGGETATRGEPVSHQPSAAGHPSGGSPPRLVLPPHDAGGVYWRVQWAGDPLSHDWQSEIADSGEHEEATSAVRSLPDLMAWAVQFGFAPTGRVDIIAFRADRVGRGADGEPLVRPTQELARIRHDDWRGANYRAAARAAAAADDPDELAAHLASAGWRQVDPEEVEGGLPPDDVRHSSTAAG